MKSAPPPRLDGDEAFDTFDAFEDRLLPRLLALPLFRLATAEEIDASYVAYVQGDFAALCDTWCRVAQPARCALTGGFGAVYSLAGLSPKMANAQAFLASLRAVLDAGARFRAQLSPPVRRAIETEFPWLERRHEHIPAGWTPRFEFPSVFSAFIDVELDAARLRWQLVTALNEVQQAHFSLTCARLFRLPELVDHAARERAMAINYFSHSAPPATRALWRQCILVLDGLNAAVMNMIAFDQRVPMIRHALVGLATGHRQWRAFVQGLTRPQWLQPC